MGRGWLPFLFLLPHPIVTEVPQVTQHRAVPDLPSLATLTVPKPLYSLGKTPVQREPLFSALAPLLGHSRPVLAFYGAVVG